MPLFWFLPADGYIYTPEGKTLKYGAFIRRFGGIVSEYTDSPGGVMGRIEKNKPPGLV